MKLRNKKTGEIVDVDFIYPETTEFFYPNFRLVDFNELFEDYEEPKESEYYWYIGYKNDIRRTKYHHISDFADNQVTATRKEIGNCFGSLEEAEKAVEKLKAWKRLKDKGFKLNAVVDTFFCLDIFMKDEPYEAIKDDLKIVFGGKE